MAILAQIGSTSVTGGQTSVLLTPTFTGTWVIERVTSGGRKVDNEELINEDGALLGILVYQKLPLLEFSLISNGGTVANAITMFPMGAMCAITELNDYFVENASVESTKSAIRISVSLRKVAKAGVWGGDVI